MTPVSIVVPCYNGAATLGASLDSAIAHTAYVL
jgi:glycosyltransferase involved in cell wall biosynthesis